MTVNGPQSFEQWGIGGELRGGPVADLVNGEGKMSLAAQGGCFRGSIPMVHSVFDRAVQGYLKRNNWSDWWSGNRWRPLRFQEWSSRWFRRGWCPCSTWCGLFRQRGSGQNGQSRGQSGDGIGRACIGKAVAAGAGDCDLIAPAAQEPGSRPSPRPRHREQCGPQCGQPVGLRVEMAHAAQIAFALFAHIAKKQKWRGEFRFRVEEGVGHGQHANHSGSVVAGARRGQAVAIDEARVGLSGVSAGKTVSRCAERMTKGPVLSGGR